MDKEFAILLASLLGVTIAIATMLIVVSVKLQHNACRVQSEVTTRVTDYKFTYWTGCYWEVDGEWWPADRFREID